MPADTTTQDRPAVCRVADVARELLCSERTVLRMIEAGQLHAFRVGRTFRVTREELDRLRSTPAGGAAS